MLFCVYLVYISVDSYIDLTIMLLRIRSLYLNICSHGTYVPFISSKIIFNHMPHRLERVLSWANKSCSARFKVESVIVVTSVVGMNGLLFILGRGWNIAVVFGMVGTNSWLFIFIECYSSITDSWAFGTNTEDPRLKFVWYPPMYIWGALGCCWKYWWKSFWYW